MKFHIRDNRDSPQTLADFGISTQSSLTDLMREVSVQAPVPGCLMVYFPCHLFVQEDPDKKKQGQMFVLSWSTHDKLVSCDQDVEGMLRSLRSSSYNKV